MNDEEREAARLKVFNRIRAANSIEGRERAIGRFEHVRKVLSLATYAIAAWLFYHPYPYALAVAAVIVALFVWIVLARMLAARGWTTDFFSLALLGCVVSLRAVMDVELVEYFPLIAMGILGSIGVTFALGAGRQSRVDQLVTLTISVFAVSGLLMIVNVGFDYGEAERFQVQVDSKHMSSAGYRRPAMFYLHFAPAPGLAAIDVRESSVSPGRYEQTKVGDVVCFRIHPGALRMRWYDVHSSSTCSTR